MPEIRVEICSKCHPFYTGQMRYVDIAGRVDKFKAKTDIVAASKLDRLSKKERRAAKRKQKVEEELSKPTSLEDLRSK